MIPHQAKLHSNVQVNFNMSKEISYWAKKMKMDVKQLQKKFEEIGSISKTITYCQQFNHQLRMVH